ncbi:pirin family protein [Pseudomonas putida]|uniref:pirin family protein n=1 Tax=Pseudomonas putida TaxID=303 RepID=UPI0023649724|nr:pirin-like C-terminal cupin domain-containing protein [Pseudomonas putida]MDD2067787.1 pirin family protein [Pseudomonas putida]HDS1738325.1 pirin family protein [Pseudomonas putida]
MTDIQVSSVVEALAVKPVGHFSMRRLNLESLGHLSRPVMRFDHYRMSGKTFSPSPHAGYAFISYVLNTSSGALRCRDSLNNDLTLMPGDLLWSQASSGLIHDEYPATQGLPVDGLQIYVNLKSSNKLLPPAVSWVQAEKIPTTQDLVGNEIKVLCGSYLETKGAIEQVEPFDLLEVSINNEFRYSPRKGSTFLIYVLEGDIELKCADITRSARQHEATAGKLNLPHECITIRVNGPSRILLLSGTDPNEAIASYGTFIMNTESEIIEALDRYRNGEMGRITPLR